MLVRTAGIRFAFTAVAVNWAVFPDLADAAMTAAAQSLPASAQSCYDIHRSELPLSCPLPSMALWNAHPRVYLPIESEGGEADCPYCGAHFVLVD